MCTAKAITECYRRAEEARRIADATDDPVARDDFKEIERRWLSVARNCKCNEQSATFQRGADPPQRATPKPSRAPRRKRS